MNNYIYGLSDPRTNNIFYVGKTIDTEKRLYGHIMAANKRSDEKDIIIDEMNRSGIKCNITILETCKPDIAFERESWWIETLTLSNPLLTNKNTSNYIRFKNGQLVKFLQKRKNDLSIHYIEKQCGIYQGAVSKVAKGTQKTRLSEDHEKLLVVFLDGLFQDLFELLEK